ncbi:hypothetical protein D5R40_02595 [Okeania hirsuta]|uniref:Uncharacterized protein n=1 Tax=Okeania hirsuta TaxID=1458930 RepID=A0A3N6RYQ8_9CYAN|nr:hypothetical protein D4Z78_08525 [Okeania hirsuta]RQH55339.1 hypothetical protein D5R40_02595 [Okeania hirsuta]
MLVMREKRTKIDYLITHIERLKVTSEWIIDIYSNRNWIEVFDREALIMFGVKRISRNEINGA